LSPWGDERSIQQLANHGHTTLSTNVADSRRRGYWLGLAGVGAIVPDGLLVRPMNDDDWTLLAWCGALSAIVIGWWHDRETVETFKRRKIRGQHPVASVDSICVAKSTVCGQVYRALIAANHHPEP
jgi:hypothetical protein